MRKLYLICILFFAGRYLPAQINYTFAALSGTYTALSSPTAIPEIYWGADDEISGLYNIGFSFQFGCTTYTQFKVSSNGWLTFNTSAAASDAVNDLSGNTTMRPGVAPLWDDLAWNNNNFPPQCGYKTTGTTPNQVTTIQWTQGNWKILGSAPGEMSFQVKLYETSNRIEFVYHRETGTLNAPSASIGLAGSAVGDYYSVNTSFTAASKTTNTQNIASKPAEGQIFRWDPNCLLPIELLSFSGEPDGKNNLLQWTTASETNNSYFTVERSHDGIRFLEIAKVKGAGNSNVLLHYRAVDEQPIDGIAYYRLRQTDFDGKFSYSPLVALDNHELSHVRVEIFPNPFFAYATVKIAVDDAPGTLRLELEDVFGRTVKDYKVEGNGVRIDRNGLPTGIYLWVLKDRGEILSTGKILIE